MKRNYFFSLLLFLVFIPKLWSQLCGGSFGDPVFTEDFGSTTVNYLQTSAPLNPAFATTTYQYTSVYPPNDGFYTIANFTGPNNRGWSWISSADHTSDAAGRYGNMLIVNADDTTTGEFYRRKVTGLCANQVYRFSAWVLNIVLPGQNQIKPNVTMQIRDSADNLLGSVSTGDIAEDRTWRNFFVDFRSGSLSGDVQVVLINNSLGGIGNDLAIDDISFMPCGPSTSVSSNITSVSTTGVCDNSASLVLTANVPSGVFANPVYKWQKSKDGILWTDITSFSANSFLNILSGTYNNGDQYRFAVVESSNSSTVTCIVNSPPIILKVNGYPNAPQVQNYIICQNSAPQTLSATGLNLKWYNSSTGGVGSTAAPLTNSSATGSVSYYVSQTVNGCESARSKIDVITIANPSPPLVSSSILTYCQDSVSSPLSATGSNLLWYSSSSGDSGSTSAPVPDTSLPGNFSYWVSQTVNSCESARREIQVKVYPRPFSSILKDAEICDGETVVLDAGPGFIDYEWNTVPPNKTQTLSVSKTGTYSVKLTDANNCTAVQSVNVTAGITPEISKIIMGDTFLEIVGTGGNPPYFYSLNNKDWQVESRFENLIPGEYKIFVKSQTNSCTAVGEAVILNIPNVITPDGDGRNDDFEIKFISHFPGAELSVFDRYGKLLFNSDNLYENKWKGDYSGRTVSTGTYWYHLQLENGFEKTGWILVKNPK